MNATITVTAAVPCRCCGHPTGGGACTRCIYNAMSLGKENNFLAEAPKKGAGEAPARRRRKKGRTTTGNNTTK